MNKQTLSNYILAFDEINALTAVSYNTAYLYPMDRISYKDSKGITHNTIVTNVNFVMNQSTEIAGKGETTQNESYDKNNGLTKQQATILETIRKKVENSLSSREQATLEMNRLLANSLGYTSPNTGADSNRVKYKNGSPQWQWERTPNAGDSGTVRLVNIAGNLNHYNANDSDGVAPACNVI